MARSDINIRIGAKLDGLQRELSKAQRRLNRFASFAEGVGTSLTTRLTLPIVGAGAAAVSTFAKFDRIEKGLQVFAGSAEAAGAQFDRLNAIVNDTRTTLDLETAAKGVQRLQTMGLSAADAENAIKQFGISATNSGDSVQEVGLALRQFGQILAKGKAEQEDFNSLFDNLGGLSRVVLEEFGVKTADQLRATGISMEDFILRTVKAIETNDQLQSVQGGLAKSFESFGNAVQVALRPVGESIAKALNLEENLQKLSDTITRLGERFAEIPPDLQRVIVGLAAAAAATGPLLLGVGAIARVSAGVANSLGLLRGGLGILGDSLKRVAGLFTGFGFSISALRTKDATFGIDGLVRSMSRLGRVLALVLSPVTLLIAGFTAGFVASQTFRDQIGELVSIIKDTAISVFAGFGGTLGSFGEIAAQVLGVLAGGVSIIVNFVSSTARLVQGLIEAKNALGNADFEGAGRALKEGVVESFNIAAGSAEDFAKVYREVVDTISGTEIGAFDSPSVTSPLDTPLPASPTQPTGLSDGANLDRLKAERAELQFNTKKLGEIITLERELDLIRKGSLGNYIEPVRQVNSLLGTNIGLTNELSKSTEELGLRIEESVRGRLTTFERFAEVIGGGLTTGIESLANSFSELAQQGALSFKTLSQALRSAVSDMIGALIKLGVARAIEGALSKSAVLGPFAIPIAAAAGTAASALFKAAISAIAPPKLAAGGIIPPGFEGDRFPAMLNSGEAVIPLQKLFNFLGDQQGRGEFILRGQDLYLAMNRAERAYNRTGG